MSIDSTTAMLAYQTQKKDALVGYLLWWFLGTLGVHRFYCNRVGSGAAMLTITLISIPLCFVLIGYLTLLLVGIWWLVDAFLIAGWVQYHNQYLVGQIEHARGTLPGGRPVGIETQYSSGPPPVQQ